MREIKESGYEREAYLISIMLITFTSVVHRFVQAGAPVFPFPRITCRSPPFAWRTQVLDNIPVMLFTTFVFISMVLLHEVERIPWYILATFLRTLVIEPHSHHVTCIKELYTVEIQYWSQDTKEKHEKWRNVKRQRQ
ncbi:hypothetical protein RB195_003158 [Necator americanus]|uniref:Uncharacterized protein n=1 Tax=Necator americanus TaxID=51031 RepID=A0ABR1DM98_NECAM